jgi:microcompartment protein CcmL/EutN
LELDGQNSNKVLLNSTSPESVGVEKLKHSLPMVHQDVQHTLLQTYEKMEENAHISDLKAKVVKDDDKKQHLDVVCSLEDFPEKSILNNSRKCLANTVT